MEARGLKSRCQQALLFLKYLEENVVHAFLLVSGGYWQFLAFIDL